MVPDRLMNCVYNTIQTLRWDNSLASHMVPWCCSIACKHGIQTLRWDNPWPCLRYLGVAHMRVQHNHLASLMVSWWCSNACRTTYKQWAETIPPMRRSNAHETGYKHWVETSPQTHWWSPGIAKMQVQHNTNIEMRQSLVSLTVLCCPSNACETQHKHCVETVGILVLLKCV